MTRPPESVPPGSHPRRKRGGVLRGLYALRYSYAGFVATLRNESAFRQEVIVAAVLIPCAVFVPVGTVERVLLVGSTLLVLLVELINSSIEAAVDRISLERSELAGRAKDAGSAAVTIAVLICAMTWVAFCGPLLVHAIRSLF